jgi:hypothetical protein
LGELFDVYSFAALASLSVEETERVAREAGKILPNGEIAGWIAQASALATEKGRSVAQKDKESDRVKTEATVPPGIPLWKPIASFVVEFQESVEANPPQRRTKVHYMEADLETTWPGIEREQLGLWIEQKVQVMEPAPTLVTKTKPAAEMADVVKPTQVRIRQWPDYLSVLDVAQPERPFLGHVHHEEPITLEVDFKLDSPAMDQTWQPQAAYSAQCAVQNLTTGQQTYFLEMKGNISTSCLTYKTKLSVVEPGMYRLAVLMRGKRPLGTAYFELPKLNVL